MPTPARANAQVVNGFLVGAFVISGGSGYVTPPAVTIVANVGSNATAGASISVGRVNHIAITSAGAGYVNPVTILIDPPPITAFSPTVLPEVKLDSSGLSPYENYQIQFKTNLVAGWQDWVDGLFSPTNLANSQYLFITSDTGFLRLQHVP